MAANDLANPGYDLLTATILRHRWRWHVMWIGAGKALRDFGTSTLTTAVSDATAMAADFYDASPASTAAEFLLLIFGRPVPVFTGPQLLVTGEPGQFTATDTRDESVIVGVTLEDLLAAAGADPAHQGDYAISWTRKVSALLPNGF
jgi:hypothetical protein